MTEANTRKNKPTWTGALALTLSLSFSFYLGGNILQPATAGDFGKAIDSKTPPSIDMRPYSQSDAGLRLLLGILTRLGNEPQLALKNDSLKADRERSSQASVRQAAIAQAQSGDAYRNQIAGGLAQNYTDPALAIRPQAAKRLTVGRAVINKIVPIDGIIDEGKIAMGTPVNCPQPMPQVSNLRESNAGRLDERSRLVSVEQSQSNAVTQATTTVAGKEGYLRDFSKDTRRGYYQQNGAQYLAQSQAPAQNYIREFGAKKQAMSADDKSPALQGATNGTVAAGSYNGSAYNAASYAGGGGGAAAALQDQSVNGIIRPSEQPGLFKYVREHSKELPKDTPRELAKEQTFAASDALSRNEEAEEKASESATNLDREIRTKAKTNKASAPRRALSFPAAPVSMAKSETAPPLLAFLPPSTVRGINGLSLGATEAETLAYLQKHGPINKSSSHGWKIWTVQDRAGGARLQIYFKGGKAEAFRIFSQEYVPVTLGVGISDNLSEMKTKFGEPSFILEEPKTQGISVAAPAKNYVYPLSQVSFQLARAGNQRPQVLSILLFKYI